MSPFEILDRLKPENFEPCVFVTSSGGRYEVRHPEMAQVAENGTVYLFLPSQRDNASVSRLIRLAYDNVTAIEPAAHEQTTGDTQ